MKKNKRNKGFTLAEVLIVVAMIGVLSGVAFISVASHLRSMIQLERDGIAKEIFVAAQNHLTMVEHEGYLNQSNYGHLEGTGNNSTEDQDSIYYFTVNNGMDAGNSGVLKLMLPFGSIDETVRLGGSYIIRYQKDPGLILDVFYCTENGRFPHAFGDGEYSTVKALAGEENKSNRRNCSALGQSVIGWYGGAAARDLNRGTELKAPLIEVINEDELYVKITNTNDDVGKIKLIIQGEKSRAQGAVLLETDGEWIKSDPDDSNSVIVILDDITVEDNKFSALSDRLEDNKQGTFIPGENITIQAVAYDNDSITNIAYSAIKTTNSLYRDVVKSEDGNTAYITSLRHLENLDSSVSNLGESITINAAAQKTDLSWKSFLENIKELNQTGTTDAEPSVKYTGSNGAAFSTEPKTYKPIVLTPDMVYDGEAHTISDVVIDIKAEREIYHAGLIETLENGTISNLMLKDFSVSTAVGDAGALAGMLTGTKTKIENVVARTTPVTNPGEEGASEGAVASGVSTSDAIGNAGGLVGSMAGGTMSYCAAAICVEGQKTAGGLIGSAGGGTVSLSYSGGHTSDGSYRKWIENKPFDVTGTIAGGLIGTADNTTIENSYSTCSATGDTAVGGLIGTGSGKVTGCYATGLVKGQESESASTGTTGTETTSASIGAFAGSFEGTLENNYYYMIINEIKDADDVFTGEYLKPVNGRDDGVAALDADAATYDAFAGHSSTAALPYDGKLTDYYGATYFLRGIAVSSGADSSEMPVFVSTHYGDWPAPEIFVINSSSNG